MMSMKIFVTIALILATIGLLILGGTFYGNRYIENRVGQKLSEEYDISYGNIESSLWGRLIQIDSLSGIAETGTIGSASLVKLDWYALYKDPKLDLRNLYAVVNDIHLPLGDGLYDLKIKKVEKVGPKAEVFELQYLPKYEDAAFHNQVKFRKPRLELQIPSIVLSDLRLDSNYIDQVEVSGFEIDIDENLNNPLSGKKKKTIGQLLADVETPFQIRNLIFDNGEIRYAVIDNGSSKKGDILFSNVKIEVENLRTDTMVGETIIDLDAYLGGGQLDLVLRNFLDHPQYKYDVYGNLSNFDFTSLNSLVNASRGVSIESGSVQELELSGSFTDEVSNGTVKIDYDQLEIDMNRNFAGILDFLSNAAIQKDNAETVAFTKQRDQDKSFFVHIIQSLIDALKDLILII